jgi:hypothetical protein
MRLHVELPDDLGVSVHVTPLRPFPEDPATWLQVSAGAGEAQDWKTRDGWPARSVEVTVDGELRIAVLFHFFRYGAGVVARGPAASAEAWRPRLLEALAGARPDWRHGQVVCLAQLLDARLS